MTDCVSSTNYLRKIYLFWCTVKISSFLEKFLFIYTPSFLYYSSDPQTQNDVLIPLTSIIFSFLRRLNPYLSSHITLPTFVKVTNRQMYKGSSYQNERNRIENWKRSLIKSSNMILLNGHWFTYTICIFSCLF